MKKLSILIMVLVSLVFSSLCIADMPYDIRREVEKRIVSRHPGNQAVQQMIMENQIKDYDYLQRLNRPNDMLLSAYEKMKEPIEIDYPYNYSLQRVLILKQLEDRSFLNDYASRSVPPDVIRAMRTKAEEEYPFNFSMQRMMVEYQVKQYIKQNR